MDVLSIATLDDDGMISKLPAGDPGVESGVGNEDDIS